ncbi:hypothetical protein MSAN_00589800 [Mycena sanguinolenta]|uniref:Uncharacterized protein n=1 Tax=Mycena sanguinolenta TaxID=230812 RepID=A0A8H7DJP8_9AGAR|nr:hypothetical protein MSAN_00589800 [Mycena sanguinolenta]
MSRTKQTAKKSTGGSNQKQLQSMLARKGPAASVAQALNKATAGNNALGVMEPKKSKNKSTGAPAPRIPLDPHTDKTVSSSMPVLDPTFPGFFAPAASNFDGSSSLTGMMSLDPEQNEGGDIVCYVCRDGGRIIMCGVKHCEAGVCVKCLGDPSPKVEGSSYSPKSYEGFEGRTDSQVITFKKGIRTRSADVRVHPQSVLLLVYALKGFPLETTPIPGLVHYLRMMLPTNFAYLQVTFDLEAPDGIPALAAANSFIENSLMTGDLQTIRRIFVIVVLHTTPETGDIHFAPENRASGPGNEVVPFLMPPTLLRTFTTQGRQPTDHLIVFMTCGFMFTVPEALSGIYDWLKKSQAFYGLIAFESEKFQPAAAGHFLEAILHEFYIHVIQASFTSEGMAKILVATFGHILCGIPFAMERVPLTSQQKQQHGKTQDLQAIKLTLRCQFCGHYKNFTKPADLTFTHKLDDGGIWVHLPLKV